jgi:hypothetical protein
MCNSVVDAYALTTAHSAQREAEVNSVCCEAQFNTALVTDETRMRCSVLLAQYLLLLWTTAYPLSKAPVRGVASKRWVLHIILHISVKLTKCA